jgi:hypothetical protein
MPCAGSIAPHLAASRGITVETVARKKKGARLNLNLI